MSLDETVTDWIDQLKAGERSATEKLWQRYYSQLVRFAGQRLGGAKREMADEEDVALSAFKSFCMGTIEGRYPQLTDRDSLWALLLTIAANKSVDLIRHANRKKRGGTGSADIKHESPSPGDPVVTLEDIISGEPSPEQIAIISEQMSRLMTATDETSPDLTRIALARMQGQGTADIAEELGCSRRTVERKLILIRQIWSSLDVE